ncbi:hypothetical protein Droror1_Dr00016426 [Drosera rotundifolia]
MSLPRSANKIRIPNEILQKLAEVALLDLEHRPFTVLRRDEQESGIIVKSRRPRAVVLCPTRELSEQVFRVAKAISHHARFRSTMISGGGRMRPQEDSLNAPVDMVVGTLRMVTWFMVTSSTWDGNGSGSGRIGLNPDPTRHRVGVGSPTGPSGFYSFLPQKLGSQVINKAAAISY